MIDPGTSMADEPRVAESNRAIIDEFRANGGRVGGPFAGAPLVLLTTTGARSGRRVTSPLMSVNEGDRVFVIASNNGSDSHPAWYHNVLANPDVTVEDGDETYSAKAVPLNHAERDEVYARQAQRVPQFAAYQAGTERVIPVVELRR